MPGANEVQARVAVVYNEPKTGLPEDHWIRRSGAHADFPEAFYDASEHGVLDEVRQIEGFLSDAGYCTVLFAADDVGQLTDFLRRERPDIIFNCCESFHGRAALEMNVAAVYELFDIPYTGSCALTLGIALDKGLSKALFRSHGVPTPRHVVLDARTPVEAALVLSPPWIVKPLAEDASIGIDRDSVVHDEKALARRAQFIRKEFHQAALVEEYIEGRELNVGILATSAEDFTTLPISEIVFEALPDGSPQIVTYEAKWLTDSAVYRATMPQCPAGLAPDLAEQIRAVAVNAARAVGLRDYGRIDMRLRRGDDAIFVLEANPNPDITFDSGFIRAAQSSGRTHAGTVVEILERAIERSGRAPRRSS